MPERSFSGASKRSGATVAVDRFRLDMAEGELAAPVGPAVGGRATSLRMLAGPDEAASGRLVPGSRDVAGLATRARNRAMAFRACARHPHLTAAENTGLALCLKALPDAAYAQRVRRCAGRLSVGHLLDRRPGVSSGGRAVRNAGAVALSAALSSLHLPDGSGLPVPEAFPQVSLAPPGHRALAKPNHGERHVRS